MQDGDCPQEEVALDSGRLRLQDERQLVQRREAELAPEQNDKRYKRDELDRGVDEDADHRRLQLVCRHGCRVWVVRRHGQVQQHHEVQRVQYRHHKLDVLGQEDVLGVEERLEGVFDDVFASFGAPTLLYMWGRRSYRRGPGCFAFEGLYRGNGGDLILLDRDGGRRGWLRGRPDLRDTGSGRAPGRIVHKAACAPSVALCCRQTREVEMARAVEDAVHDWKMASHPGRGCGWPLVRLEGSAAAAVSHLRAGEWRAGREPRGSCRSPRRPRW